MTASKNSPLQLDRMSMPITCADHRPHKNQRMQSPFAGEAGSNASRHTDGKENAASVEQHPPPALEKININNVIMFLHQCGSCMLLDNLLSTALNNIENKFFKGKDPQAVLHNIRQSVRSAHTNKKMMLFFLLLNVDNDLKTCIMQHEPLPTQRKIARFLQDLRQVVVPGFYVNDGTSAQSFVTQCMELYIIS